MHNEGHINHYLPFLKILLKPLILQHSLEITQVIAELLSIYSLDRERALTADLLHDVVRDLNHEEQLALAAEARIDL